RHEWDCGIHNDLTLHRSLYIRDRRLMAREWHGKHDNIGRLCSVEIVVTFRVATQFLGEVLRFCCGPRTDHDCMTGREPQLRKSRSEITRAAQNCDCTLDARRHATSRLFYL